MPNLYAGNPIMVDHTPGTAVAAGAVVVVDRSPRIAHRDIAANTLGALAAKDGIYNFVADGAIANGRKVFWNAAASKVTLTATGNLVIGIAVTASGADGDTIYVLHEPDGNVAA
jgi:predicted RecA/RadA family phage recombinase